MSCLVDNFKFLNMKKHYIPLFLTLSISILSAKNYYVSSSSGSDANSGVTNLLPWKTITKVNNMMSIYAAGDSILFKSGDTFTEMLNISKSGLSTSPINFGSYGIGAKPLFNTALTLGGWTATVANPNIWVANYTGALTDIRYLSIDGKMQRIGRYPDISAANDGFLYSDQSWLNNKFRDAALSVTTQDWTGATAVVYATPYSINLCPITKHLLDTVFLGKITAYPISAGYGYFIQNHLATLTTQGEWFFDKVLKKAYLYSVTTPSTNKVQISATEHCINFTSGVTGVTIKNLAFRHADSTAIAINTGNYITVANCDFQNLLYGVRCVTSNNINISNNNFVDIFNTAIGSTAISTNITVMNNTIKRNALVQGLGSDGSSVGNNAISIYCTAANISYNTIDSCSYIGIRYEGWANQITHNQISNFNMKQFDGAGIYSFGTWSSRVGLPNLYGNNLIENNYIHDGIGYRLGTNAADGMNREPGIYCDYLSENNTIHHNVLYNTNGVILNTGSHHHVVDDNTIYNSDAFEMAHPNIASIEINKGSAFQTVMNNTLFNVTQKIDYNPYTGFNVGRSVDTIPPNTNHGNRVAKNIVFSSKNYRHLPINSGYSITDYPQYFNQLDSNYYWQPFALDTMVATYSDSGYVKTKKVTYGIQQWKQYEPHAIFKFGEIAATYGTLGTNLFASNSSLTSNLTGWSFDSENAVNPCFWAASGLDAGTCVLSLTGASTASNLLSSARLVRGIGTVAAGDVYILKFSMKANTDAAYVDIYPTSTLSTPKMYKTSMTRKEYSVPLCFSQAATSQSLYIGLHDKNAEVYLDNITLQKATVIQANPDSVLRFEVNTTDLVKQVNLGSISYIDFFGTVYNGMLNLQPYSSKILMKYQLLTNIESPNIQIEASQPLFVTPLPNPNHLPLKIAVQSNANTKAMIRIVSVNGEQVFKQNVSLTLGHNMYEVTALRPGFYVLELKTEDGSRSFKKFIQ